MNVRLAGMDAPVPFAKMHGSGNDFVVIDNRRNAVAADRLPTFVRQVCRRGMGLGADGIVTIEAPVAAAAGSDFRWRYHNADGSEGEMCGNGAMCGARFAAMRGIAPWHCRFETPSGIVAAVVDPDSPRVRIAMPASDPMLPAITLDIAGHTLGFHPLRVGVPHAVTIVDDADAFATAAAFVDIGGTARRHPAFAPDGANVNVASRIDATTLRMRTYERGVEAETLACGTGAVATAIVGHAVLGMALPLRIRTSSGRPLDVDFTWRDGIATDISLTGEARIVATGELDPEGWLV